MDKKATNNAYYKAKERNEDAYEKFRAEFDKQIALGEPEAGTTRFQLLEGLIHNLNNDIILSNMKYVNNMIDTLDEEEIIESKKENS